MGAICIFSVELVVGLIKFGGYFFDYFIIEGFLAPTLRLEGTQMALLNDLTEVVRVAVRIN